MIPSGVSNGKASAAMKFFRLTSTGSMSSSAASWSIMISIQWVISGRPAPRIASVSNLLVNTPVKCRSTFGMS